jgi:hypothetical protein
MGGSRYKVELLPMAARVRLCVKGGLSDKEGAAVIGVSLNRYQLAKRHVESIERLREIRKKEGLLDNDA